MAIGLTPHYQAEMFLDDLTHKQFLVIALRAVQYFDWKVIQTSDAGIIAVNTTKVFKWKAKITINIGDDRAVINSESMGNEMVDWGKNKGVVERFQAAFNECKYSVTPETAETEYEALEPTLTTPEQVSAQKSAEKQVSFFSLFIPRSEYFVTPILIDINILVFILMAAFGANILEPDTATLLEWGANFGPLTMAGQWWRLVTCMFLHIGIVHILLNMYALLLIGILLEPRLGKLRFATAYLLTGILASMTSTFWHNVTVSAGASGAIFGMYGVFLAMLSTNLIEKTARKPLLVSIVIFVIYNLVYGLKAGIDNAAHVGGLVSGIVVGYLFIPGLKSPDRDKLVYGGIAAATLVAIVASLFLYRGTSKDILVYDQKMKEFARNEQTALAYYRLPEGFTKTQEISAIQDSGFVGWNKNIQMLDDLRLLDLPTSLAERNGLLMQYCVLRLQEYQYLNRRITDTAWIPGDSATYFRKQISSILRSLNGDDKAK